MGRQHDPDDGFPGLPVPIAPVSNAEYTPPPLRPVDREVIRRTVDAAGDNARRKGMSRRRFLLSACGTATQLAILAACSNESTRGDAGGTYAVPSEAPLDTAAALAAVSGDEFVFDVQTHFLQYDLSAKIPSDWFGSGFPQASCGADDPRACFSIDRLLGEVFLRSDTRMMVISALPFTGDENHETVEAMVAARRVAETLCGDDRVLIQGQVNPSVGAPSDAIDDMARVAEVYGVKAWKTYTHAGGPPWRLDDADGSLPQVGMAMIAQAKKLGIPIVSVHKGLSDHDPASSPADVGPAAAAFADVDFVVYHSGYEPGTVEGPFDPSAPNDGIDRLLLSIQEAGIKANSNVHAELGSTWYNLMRSPTEAAHAIGKLLKYVGEDNVIWGTDSIWYGSPQGQIQAFRAFEISAEMQERYGYPALTQEVKNKILGLNAARLYGVEPKDDRCRATQEDLDALRSSLPAANALYGPGPDGRMPGPWVPI